MKKFYFFLTLALFLPLTTQANLSDNSIQYAQGHKRKAPHVYLNASDCKYKPCVVGKYGAIRFSDEIHEKYQTKLSYISEDMHLSLALFQEGSEFKQGLFERMLNQVPNRKIFNLENSIDTGSTKTVFVYGIFLHHNLKEGDLIVLDLINPKDPKDKFQYFFRYHKQGPIFDADVALINPINHFMPNPNDQVKYASISMALSFSVGWYMDPDRKYSFLNKFLYGWRFNVFTGLLRRHELTQVAGGDNIVDAQFDGFVGLGFTFADFFIGGMGINMARSPHSFFPFVGIEVKHMYQFLRNLRKSTKRKWNNYLKEQNGD